MRYVIGSLALVATVVGFCLWSALYVTAAVEDTEQWLGAAYDAAHDENQTEALAAVERAAAIWKRHGDYFGTVLRHDEIDGVAGEFARLDVTVRAGDWDEFLPSCAALLETLRHIREMELPYFFNIL